MRVCSTSVPPASSTRTLQSADPLPPQIFNEFNARSITNSWNIVKGLRNPMFLGVIVFTVLAQFLIVQEGGSFTRYGSLLSFVSLDWASLAPRWVWDPPISPPGT